MKHNNSIHQETINFVSNHRHATSDLIPEHLLNNWLVKDETELEDRLKLFSDIHSTLKPSGIEKDRQVEYFYKFQIFLQLEFILRTLQFPIEVERVKIFDFDNYNEEQITIAQDIIQITDQLQTN